jgi:inorganic pyrophosphatase
MQPRSDAGRNHAPRQRVDRLLISWVFFMSPRSARHAVLSEISPFDGDGDDDVRIVIETPRGSRSKYSYDPECDCMQLSTVLPEGMVFPYDFGFIPSTLGEDGDPLDILVLMEASVIPGCVVRARLIGAIEAEQKEKGEGWTRNDRLIAIATHAQTYDKAKKLSDPAAAPSRRDQGIFRQLQQAAQPQIPGDTRRQSGQGTETHRRGNEHLQEKAAQGCVTRGLRHAATEFQPPRPLCSRSLLRQFDPGLHPVVPENPIRLGFAREAESGLHVGQFRAGMVSGMSSHSASETGLGTRGRLKSSSVSAKLRSSCNAACIQVLAMSRNT